MILFVKRMACIATRIILIVGCICLATEVKAIEKRRTSPNPKYKKMSANKDPLIYNSIRRSNSYRMKETPHLAIKTNLLFDLTTSMNLGMEVRVWRKLTLDVPFTLNPWTYNKEDNSKFKFFLVQPELRYWTCEAFNGHFFGVHTHYAYYNVGHLYTPPFSETMNSYRFEGQLVGAGLSYGYHWLMGSRFSMESEIGAGYARMQHGKYPCQTCAKLLINENKNYWGLTRVGLSLIYLF